MNRALRQERAHQATPLVYEVTWQQFLRLVDPQASPWIDGLVDRVASVLGDHAAAEVLFELASGRCPQFVPVSPDLKVCR